MTRAQLPVGNELTRCERPTTVQSDTRAEPWPVSADDPYASLAAFQHVLAKRRWTVLTTLFVVGTLTAIASFKMQPVYRATARVEVEAETRQIQSINDLYQQVPTNDAFLATQIQVLKSETLAWRTIEQAQLAHSSEFGTGALGDPAREKARLIALFRRHVRAELVPKTRMLEVGFESVDPRLAAQVTNALVTNYLDYNFRQKYDATRQASGFLEQQLDELKARVERSQQAMVDYERQHSILSTSDRENVAQQNLAELSRAFTTAQAERIQRQSLYEQVQADRAQLARLAQNELLQRLEEKLAELRQQYVEAEAQYGPKFPKVTRLAEQVAEIQRLIEREQNRVVDRIRSEYLTALNRERLATAAVTRQKDEVGRLNSLLIEHNILRRDFEGNQQLYQNLLQRLKDATVSAGLRSTNIHPVDAALPPTSPVRPQKALNIALGILGGALLGVMLAFVQQGLDSSIKTSEEIESLVGLPTLALIPLGRSSRYRYAALGAGPSNHRSGRGAVELTVFQRPSSELAESYRALRTALLLSAANSPPHLLLITSANAREGKTATALNLAQSLAQRQRSVVLLDCDLRRPGVSSALGLEEGKGLSLVLTGKAKLEDGLQPWNELPNLVILPAGPLPGDPAELLSSPAMEVVLEELRQRFQHVVLDSPPVLAMTDATILSRLVDGVVLVTESGVTPYRALVRSRRILESAGARILGVALNKVDLRFDGYYGHYYSHYYNRYYSKHHA